MSLLYLYSCPRINTNFVFHKKLIISHSRTVTSKDVYALLPLQIEVLRCLVGVDDLAVEDELEALERDVPLFGVLLHHHRELLGEADDELHLGLSVLGAELEADLGIEMLGYTQYGLYGTGYEGSHQNSGTS